MFSCYVRSEPSTSNRTPHLERRTSNAAPRTPNIERRTKNDERKNAER